MRRNRTETTVLSLTICTLFFVVILTGLSRMSDTADSDIYKALHQDTVVVIPVMVDRNACELVAEIAAMRPAWPVYVFRMSPAAPRLHECKSALGRARMIPFDPTRRRRLDATTEGSAEIVRRNQTLDTVAMLEFAAAAHPGLPVLILEDDSKLCASFFAALYHRPRQDARLWFAGFGGSGVLVAADVVLSLASYLVAEQYASNVDVLFLKFMMRAGGGGCAYKTTTKVLQHMGWASSVFASEQDRPRACGAVIGRRYLFAMFQQFSPAWARWCPYRGG